MSKQDFEIVIVGSGRHHMSVLTAIEGGLLERFSGAMRCSYPPSPIYSEPKSIARDLSIQSLVVTIDNDRLALSSGVVDMEALRGAEKGVTSAQVDEQITAWFRSLNAKASMDEASGKVSPLGKAYWESQLSSGAVSVEAVQGFTTGYATDPLESAISSTLSAIRDERESGSGLSLNDHINRDATLSILGAHLIRLLELQVTQLNEPAVVEHGQVGDVTHTEITTGRR